ncbi:hypothetical protein HELRODRAFT_99188 [Helobdella robusta]|uniref:Transmembrane protein 144 n=1 Tax=Helobdella robusta TaxID=6412 RepID=T1G9R3_HELRO|nr:hypothetical protein HELRODRAFT_99188 [Helobdella robusta]ESO05399.1 hypothetical protein HELRODRAFT_99188 [Helobdella robusta]
MESTTFSPSNSTDGTPEGPSVAVGYVAVAITVILFGSNYIPVKKFYSGNGMFFQWILCTGVWSTGMITAGIRGFKEFEALPLIGGALWCTANLTSVPIINSIGLGKGLLVWGSFNLLSGWASSRYGWFGVKDQAPQNKAMNYAGVSLCLISASIYLFIKTSGNEDEDETDSADSDINEFSVESNNRKSDPNYSSKSFTITPDEDNQPFYKKSYFLKIKGTLMAVIAGIMYGLVFIPVVYLKDNVPGSSQNGLDYVFPHYCGILSASTIYFIAYSIVSKNNPIIYSNIIFPGYVSGLMWGTACIGWFIANDALSESISFPIVATIPGIIAALWGLFFREITGWKNYLVLAVAIIIGMAGSILTGLSK